jgi:hypothetical protein
LLFKAINIGEDNKAIVHDCSIVVRVVCVWVKYTKVFAFDLDFGVRKGKRRKYKTRGINRIVVKN